MKKFFLTTILALAAAGVADAACLPGLAGRQVARTRTVTTAKQTVKVEPKTVTVEKTVLVPTKVQTTETRLVATPGPVVTETRTKATLRGRLFGAQTCATCK